MGKFIKDMHAFKKYRLFPLIMFIEVVIISLVILILFALTIPEKVTPQNQVIASIFAVGTGLGGMMIVWFLYTDINTTSNHRETRALIEKLLADKTDSSHN